MVQKKTNSIVVVDDNGDLVGLLNTGILIREVIPDYLEEDGIAAHFANETIFKEEVARAKESIIKNFMIKNPKKIHFNANLMEVAVMAISSKQFRIPVVNENNKPVGLVTRTELKRVFANILGLE